MLRLAGCSCVANRLYLKLLDKFMITSPCYTKGKGWRAHVKLDHQLTSFGNMCNGFKTVGTETEKVPIHVKGNTLSLRLKYQDFESY